MEKLQFKYEAITKWIESADLKAQILIGIQLFILGYILEKQINFTCLSSLVIFVFLCFLGASTISLYNLYRIIKPRLSNNIYGSRIYFRDIAKNVKNKPEEIKDLLVNEKDEDYRSDLADQIIALAKVCNEKYEYLLKAEKFIILSFFLGLLLYILNNI